MLSSKGINSQVVKFFTALIFIAASLLVIANTLESTQQVENTQSNPDKPAPVNEEQSDTETGEEEPEVSGINFSWTPETPRAGNQVEFEAEVTGRGGINKYQWQFDQGDISEQPQPSYSFEKSGEYPVKLTVETNSDSIMSVTRTVEVARAAP